LDLFTTLTVALTSYRTEYIGKLLDWTVLNNVRHLEQTMRGSWMIDGFATDVTDAIDVKLLNPLLALTMICCLFASFDVGVPRPIPE
jgi:hypothetical protein